VNDKTDGYHHLPGRVQTEPEKRWLSWSILTAAGAKKSYTGTVDPATKAKRRAKAKLARIARRKNR
jgi:hypothetical protein